MKRYLPLLLILCLLLCACSQGSPDQTTTSPTAGTSEAPSEQSTVADTTAEATEETTAPDPTEDPTEETVAIVRYRNPLNGTPVDTPWTTRPFAVTMNNIQYAQPICSLSHVDFLFEVLAEGGITRCLGVFSDVNNVDHIGSIRSARPYFADLASSFDAIYVHHGGTDDGYGMIRTLGVNDLDADDGAYYRDQDRLDAGYALEHTSFADGNDLLDAATDLSYRTTSEDPLDYGFQFADVGSTGDGTDSSQMTVTFGGQWKQTTVNYNAEAGAYNTYQYGNDVIDGNTNETVNFKNVLVLIADTRNVAYGNYTVLDITLTGTGEGYFASNGKYVPITWSREDQYSPFVFAHEDGTPITFAVGSTYVAVTPSPEDVEIQ